MRAFVTDKALASLQHVQGCRLTAAAPIPDEPAALRASISSALQIHLLLMPPAACILLLLKPRVRERAAGTLPAAAHSWLPGPQPRKPAPRLPGAGRQRLQETGKRIPQGKQLLTASVWLRAQCGRVGSSCTTLFLLAARQARCADRWRAVAVAEHTGLPGCGAPGSSPDRSSHSGARVLMWYSMDSQPPTSSSVIPSLHSTCRG